MMLTSFLKFLWYSKNVNRIHSPFIQEFMTGILFHVPTSRGLEIEALRSRLCDSEERIPRIDYGAGSRFGQTQEKDSIANIARKSARGYYQGEFLLRLCQHFRPRRGLEFGTNLGISTLYQLSGFNQGRFITLEGSPFLAEKAEKHFKTFQFSPEIVIGEFSESLESRINLSEYRPDYVFLDGNHRYESTLKYVNAILPVMPENSLLIMDDINWSKGMRKAWKEIVARQEISISVDLFSMGIGFVKADQPKEYFPLFWPGLFKFIL